MIEQLVASIRDALLSENAFSLNNIFIESLHPDIDPDIQSNLRHLAIQIDDKAKDIFANASAILDTFELATPLVPPSFDFNDQNELLLLGNINNFVLESSDEWMEDIYEEVEGIASWEDNVQNLSHLVMTDFDASRDSSSTSMEKNAAFREMMSLYNDLKSNKRRDVDKNLVADHHDTPPPNNSFWEGIYSETSHIPPHLALETIANTTLKSYLLRSDNQRDVVISEKERKTRRHIGVIDTETIYQNVTINGKVDPAAVFSYNIGALSHLATLCDDISTKMIASSTFLRHGKVIQSQMRELNESLQNPRELTFNVAALEAEQSLLRIELMSRRLIHSIDLNMTLSRQSYLETSLVLKDASAERMSIAEREYKSMRESHIDHADASLDALLVYFSALDDMKSIYNSTLRDLLEMVEEAAIEANVAQEVIHAEAEIERENEYVSINQIKLLGSAQIEEIVQSIENIFWNLAGCFHHIVSTSTGRQQFVFYIGVVAALVLTISTIKEVISLGCAVILRLLITPRLVRKYGNSRFRMRCWSDKAETQMDSIILSKPVKTRIEQVTKTALEASKRRFPMRNILLHGKPGCGKSMTAVAIAQSIHSLPYAIMSGADIFPMGNQGPSELRRLLSWANTNGGIIIIDEAESALGKRGRAVQDDEHQQQDFSRDCLNVLLSLTGTMGNIMLILTTTKPGELDDAVLDRMDEIIHLPPLAPTERSDLLTNHFSRLFELKTDAPTSSFIGRMMARVIRRSTMKACYDNTFDVSRSISDLANTTQLENFSGRELEKLLQGVAYKTYASDAGVLDQTLWDTETKTLVAAFTAKHLGMSSKTNRLSRRVNQNDKTKVKGKKRIVLQPKSSPAEASDDDDGSGLGYGDWLLGNDTQKEKRKQKIVPAADTPPRKIITRSVMKSMSTRRARTPLRDITPRQL